MNNFNSCTNKETLFHNIDGNSIVKDALNHNVLEYAFRNTTQRAIYV